MPATPRGVLFGATAWPVPTTLLAVVLVIYLETNLQQHRRYSAVQIEPEVLSWPLARNRREIKLSCGQAELI